MLQLALRDGSEVGKAKIALKGKGAVLPMPDLGALSFLLTMQVVNRGDGVCWEAVYTAPFMKHDPTQFMDKAD